MEERTELKAKDLWNPKPEYPSSLWLIDILHKSIDEIVGRLHSLEGKLGPIMIEGGRDNTALLNVPNEWRSEVNRRIIEASVRLDDCGQIISLLEESIDL